MEDMQELIGQLSPPAWKFWASPDDAARRIAALGAEAAPAVPALVEALMRAAQKTTDTKKLDPVVNGTFADALFKIGPAALPPLITHFASPVEPIRYVAVEVVACFGATAVPALVGALESSDKNVRANAGWAVERIGAAAADAVPALHRALSDALKPDAVFHRLDRSGKMQQVEIRHEEIVEEQEFLRGLASRGPVSLKPFRLRDHSLTVACLAALKKMGRAAQPTAGTVLYALEVGQRDLAVKTSAEWALREMSGENYGSDVGKWREWVRSHGVSPEGMS